jgi:hypothetical protein
VHRTLRVNGNYYLISALDTTTKVYILDCSGNLTLINQVQLKRINHAHYCTGADHLIFRIGGYWIDNQHDKLNFGKE